MSRDSNESEEFSKDQVGSPSMDDVSCGGSMTSGGGGGGGSGLKKGPWTAAEDAILMDYVKKHGEGNWNAVQKHSGLFRCGKSCRLRWANHLRPNLKKGAFSPEEENIIIDLHSKMGNKWARMAAHLPGRTDNEIKNYWNTRIKRRQRAGLPLYPPEMQQGSKDNQQIQGVGDFSNDNQHNDFLQGNGYDISFMLDSFNASQGALTYASPYSANPLGCMLSKGFGSQSYDVMNSSINCKRPRESEALLLGYHDDSVSGGHPLFDNFSNAPCEKIHRTMESSYPYEPDSTSKSLVPYEGTFIGSHAVYNGNFSASKPLTGNVKLELPSLQYTENDLDSWFTCPYSPPSETVDTYIQSPLETVSVQSECTSVRNSGLLQELVHESEVLHSGKKQFSDKSSNSSVMTPSDRVESSAGWDEYSDPISPLGCSAASVFNESTPPISGCSLDEFPPSKGPSGLDDILCCTEHDSTPMVAAKDISSQPQFLRPDALLGSSWFVESSQAAKDHAEMNNAIAALLGNDFGTDHNPPSAGVPSISAAAGTSSSSAQNRGLNSCPWNNMPPVCQMNEVL